MKNSKYPVISSVPFNSNTASPKRFCAATRLLELTRKRKRDGAGPDEALFVNPKSGGPLTTGVANSHLKKFLRKFCTKKGLPPRYSKLFSLKSFRKAVATEMQKRGASPQSIAKHLKHASIDSQMSYICKYHKQNQQLEKDLYNCITPPTAQSRDRKPKHT
jgi:site-specific recombinase XerD